MATVPGHAGVLELVLGDQLIELLPKIDVLDGRMISWLAPPPAVGLPLGHPFAQAFANVDTVGQQFHVGRSRERLEPLDDGHQLHAVVRGLRLAAAALHLFARRGVPEDEGPATWARVAAASAI